MEALTPDVVLSDSAVFRSFIDDAVHWCHTGSEASLARLIRSSCCGVPHDVGAAYATLAARTGALLDAIDRGRLALPPSDRDSVLRFARAARRIRAFPELEPQALRQAIADAFAISSTSRAPLARGARPAREVTAEFALAEPLPPEEPRCVAAWRKHFSASALNTYAECKRKWFFKYACAAVEDPGSAASAYGSAFHLALEDFHGEFPRPKNAAGAAMRRRIRECVTWAFERNRDGFGTSVEFVLQVRRAQRTAQRYVDWLLAQEKEAPFEVVGREVAAELDIEGRPFVGYIDRLDRDDRSGGMSVVDYKTGSIATSAAEYGEQGSPLSRLSASILFLGADGSRGSRNAVSADSPKGRLSRRSSDRSAGRREHRSRRPRKIAFAHDRAKRRARVGRYSPVQPGRRCRGLRLLCVCDCVRL